MEKNELHTIFPNENEKGEAELIQVFGNTVFKMMDLNDEDKLPKYLKVMKSLESEEVILKSELDKFENLKVHGYIIDEIRIKFPKINDEINKICIINTKEEVDVYEVEYIDLDNFDEIIGGNVEIYSVNLDGIKSEKYTKSSKNFLEIYKIIGYKIWEILYHKNNIAVDMEMSHGLLNGNPHQVGPPNIKIGKIVEKGSGKCILNLIITDIANSINEMPINLSPDIF